ncbi:acyl--CoA ligase [Sulfitobacter sp. M57]|uniref:class I adenylate-forming enzyme family protein n=1 Tax=unclassified Sulfitobacter TaxID=196795 RepID=UPI0023E1565F|nr:MULTISPECIES: class I adenylate-forming enzyme family protein [unclassified Sulfitobacter]MDF3413796.1 acyl--CoA ligase [Sulfitobacter sp. KE5]MDF3420923.1 acyl--CoA ligase [Sulfitobacter sp. KE43]MDF3432342.1 acyl--CoA ligase [Sulfitobacter sp. KE42]MDF3457981.1 acyl--CoA ligase [Sulfitobacter sp. S74]MDF3461882.1 acyl--CoA ligase [Sulfitobacter sp. Ks18]
MTKSSDTASPFNLAAYVLEAGTRLPDKIALSLLSRDGSEDWTYARLIAAVRGTATGLLENGLSPGDIVLMRLGNTPDFPIAYLGALAAGLVPVPTAAALTAHEVAKIIPALKPAAILHDADVASPDFTKVIDLNALRKMRDLPPAPFHMGDPERLGYIIYTSGTSGKPTAVMHAHRAILARQMMFDGWYGLTAQDRLLHAGAFNWTYTLGTGLMDPWTRGATALIPVAGTPPAALPDLMKTHKASIFAAAPGVYRQMLRDLSPLYLPALRHGLSAGEKMTAIVRDTWAEITNTPVYEAFGMSECSTFISGNPTTPAKDGAIGAAQPGRQVAILGPKGPARIDTPGTIAIHRTDPGLMLGYMNDSALTKSKFDGDWFLTGDQGMMDAQGQITYLGRTDDMMNAGGFRVSPLEVEETLLGIPGVTGIGVTEVEIKKNTQVIAAFYTAAAPIKEYTLTDFATANLARYKQPRLYVHVDALPTSGNGKIQRSQLRDSFEAQK